MSDTTKKDQTLASMRQEIDAIDSDLLALLGRRAHIVGQLSELKKSNNQQSAPASAMRPGREAQIIRRIFSTNTSTLPNTAMAGLWRGIVSVFLRLQYPFTAHVATGPGGLPLWDMARVHFGPDTPLVSRQQTEDVIDQVIRDNHAVGVVPSPGTTDAASWWKLLPPAAPGKAQIVARLPFFTDKAITDESSGYIIARADREASGEDVTLLRLGQATTDLVKNFSNLPGIQILLQDPDQDRFDCLIAAEGYLTEKDEAFLNYEQDAITSGAVLDIIGGYALPIRLKDEQ